MQSKHGSGLCMFTTTVSISSNFYHEMVLLRIQKAFVGVLDLAVSSAVTSNGNQSQSCHALSCHPMFSHHEYNINPKEQYY